MTQALVFLHVAGAVVLMGELLFGSLWLRSAMSRGGSPALLRYTLATMTWTSKSLALPAILVNLIAGLALLHFSGVHMGTALWLWISLALYVVVTGMWHGMLIPMRKRMLAKLEASGGNGSGDGAASAETLAMAAKWVSASGAVTAMLFVILLLMIWKPTL